MKDWVMIHKIKAMYDKNAGGSIQEISRSLGVSRNTVRKYIRMDEPSIQEALESPERCNGLSLNLCIEVGYTISAAECHGFSSLIRCS
jgi:hypothetical protein